MRGRFIILLLAILSTAAPRAVQAQDEMSRAAGRNVLSANPFLLIATWFNAEYERVISATSTVGVRLSTVSIGVDDELDGDNDADYFNGRAFWRYYPSGAPAGFFFGFDAGVTGLDESGESRTVLGAGFELGYNWLLGSRRNFYISLGAGADRLFGGDLGHASAVIPTVRIVNIGIAFD
jgi:hypothetical protein